ncbi:MAG TPA: 16S rRNA (cytidine(1402)-2'-O)-methyltransferase [Patescibacteria group bacterium]|nr:16S rRNA (cytidine(1402)-2'-O)-methyltransferase [Patescibacteria group bacterium]
MGNLYIVATPIGNLQDITLRAIEILRKVDSIACEDTRKTGILLKKLGLSGKHLLPYYEQTEERRIPEIINALKNGLNIALVSDAGTPTISDPGFKLVRECLKEGIRVESIPGPSSVISSLVSSGLPTDKFLFVGYPPKKPGHRKTLFENLRKSSEILPSTVILFEAPHKLIKTLEDMKAVLGDVDITLARELTKVYEEVSKDKISSQLEKFKKITPKGEFVLLFNLKLKSF